MTERIGKEWVNQRSAFVALSRFCAIAGKRVLEIGGSSACAAALPFAEQDAASVVVTGLEHVDISAPSPHSNITFAQADALELVKLYPDNSFDLIYGISVLEHIPCPAQLLLQLARVLVKGGMVFLQGDPLWSGPWGHHIWLTPWYDGTTGCYQFTPYEGKTIQGGINVLNPIPDWGHLLYSPDELSHLLSTQSLPPEDVSRIVDFVFHSTVINREPVSAIQTAIHQSAFDILELEFDRVQIDYYMAHRLKNMYSYNEDFSIGGLRAVLVKP